MEIHADFYAGLKFRHSHECLIYSDKQITTATIFDTMFCNIYFMPSTNPPAGSQDLHRSLVTSSKQAVAQENPPYPPSMISAPLHSKLHRGRV